MNYYTSPGVPVPPQEDPQLRRMLEKEMKKRECRAIRKDMSLMSWAGCTMFVFVNIIAIVLQVFCMIFAPGDLSTGGTTIEMYYLLQCAASAVAVPLAFLIFALAKEMDLSFCLRFEKAKFGHCLLYVGFGVLICMLANYPATFISDFITDAGLSDVTQSIPLPDTWGSSVAAVAAVALLPPLVEEFAFRGIVLSRLRRHGELLAVLGSALVFAFAHGNVVQIPFAFCAGIALGVAYVKTNNLLVPIAIHAINNGFSVSVDLLLIWAGEDIAVAVSNYGFLALLLIGVICAIIMIVMILRGSEILTFENPETELSPIGRFWALVSNPGFLVMLGYTALSCALLMVAM